jgi:hypothetical protein
MLQVPSAGAGAAMDERRSCNPPPPVLQVPSVGAIIGGRQSYNRLAAVLEVLLLMPTVAATAIGATIGAVVVDIAAWRLRLLRQCSLQASSSSPVTGA